MPKTKSGNGGASFAAWQQKVETTPDVLDWPPPDMLKLPEALPPGFYRVPRGMSGEQVLARLFADAPHKHLVNRIKALNPTFAKGFKAGEMFVLGNLINPAACSREEADLIAAAAKVRTALEPLSESEANFMADHQAEIALMVGGASASLGLGTDVLGNGLKQIESTLRDIEYLHQREFAAHGHLRSQQFFTSRQQLYRQLDNQLKATFLGKQLGLGNYPTLRQDLGISTRSLVHRWSKGGAPGQIPGYATHIRQRGQIYFLHPARSFFRWTFIRTVPISAVPEETPVVQAGRDLKSSSPPTVPKPKFVIKGRLASAIKQIDCGPVQQHREDFHGDGHPQRRDLPVRSGLGSGHRLEA